MARIRPLDFRAFFQFGANHVLDGLLEGPFPSPGQCGFRPARIATKAGDNLLGRLIASGDFDEILIIQTCRAEGAGHQVGNPMPLAGSEDVFTRCISL